MPFPPVLLLDSLATLYKLNELESQRSTRNVFSSDVFVVIAVVVSLSLFCVGQRCCGWMDLGMRIWHRPHIFWQGQMTSQRRERVGSRSSNTLIFDYYTQLQKKYQIWIVRTETMTSILHTSLQGTILSNASCGYWLLFQSFDREDCCSSAPNEMSSSSGTSPNSRLGFHQYFPSDTGNK